MPGPPLDLSDRVALVTGSSRGLGAATARRLAQRGADVVVTYRRRDADAEEVAEAVRAAGRRAWTRKLDLSHPQSVDGLFDWLAGDGGPGRLDVLVANAAATSFVPLMDARPRQVERTFAITVSGFLQCVQRAVPLMEEVGGGRIVAVSGADTQTWIPAHGLLGAAKSALETLVGYLACELGDRGITVVAVAPGWMAGDSLQKMLGPFYEPAVDWEERTHPLREAATPDDVAEAVALLCTDAARLLHGSTVNADGAGVFAFCGRYASAGATATLLEQAGGERPADGAGGDAPSIPL